jgi:hypothetical protein
MGRPEACAGNIGDFGHSCLSVRAPLGLIGKADRSRPPQVQAGRMCPIGGDNAGVVERDDQPHGGRRGRRAHGIVRLGPWPLAALSSGSASRNS